MLQQVLDVDLPVLTAFAVDVGGRRALAAFDVARQAQTLLCQRHVQRLQVARRVDERAVISTLVLDGPVPLADAAPGAVCCTFVALVVAASTAFQLQSHNTTPA